jgi:short subunit dehydrogenase-like uncharacterized protein
MFFTEATMDWMIYGANGYTGDLIAREAKRRGAAPVLAGRRAGKIAELARELSLPSKVFSLDAPLDVAAALGGVGLVLNCAGPFSKTADLLMRACLPAKAHYLDITGEIDVLEGAHRLDTDAKTAGVVLCPGVGFDVTPTDCIALMLKTALPEAQELALGFESDHRMSAGTAKTLAEALGKSGKIRRGGSDRRPCHRPWLSRRRFRPTIVSAEYWAAVGLPMTEASDIPFEYATPTSPAPIAIRSLGQDSVGKCSGNDSALIRNW